MQVQSRAYDPNTGNRADQRRPAPTSDTLSYDADDRIVRRAESLPAPPGGTTLDTLHAESLAYDARGKALTVASLDGTSRNSYAGLGWLESAQYQSESGPQKFERWYADALGNARQYWSASNTSSVGVRTYTPWTGRLVRTAPNQLSIGAQLVTTDTAGYDEAGNEHLLRRVSPSGKVTATMLSYYGADERVRVVDRRVCDASVTIDCAGPLEGTKAGAWESYRYDALGRRVLLRSVREPYCSGATDASCRSTIERFVWDGGSRGGGAELLYEIRMPGADTVVFRHAADLLESDTVVVKDVTGAPYGRVAYTQWRTRRAALWTVRWP